MVKRVRNNLGTTLAILAGFTVPGCKPPEKGGPAAVPSENRLFDDPASPNDPDGGSAAAAEADSQDFPIGGVLTSRDGRKLAGAVIAKQGSRIAFRRTIDQKEFLIPVGSLSTADQTFLARVPDGNSRVIARIESGVPASTPQTQPAATTPQPPPPPQRAHWTENYQRARNDAKKYDLPMFLLFTGSDWCPPCKRLERDVLSSDEFRRFAGENLILVKLDFPRTRSSRSSTQIQNEQLKSEFRVSSFPTVVLIDVYGNQVARFGGYGGQSPSTYVDSLRQALKE